MGRASSGVLWGDRALFRIAYHSPYSSCSPCDMGLFSSPSPKWILNSSENMKLIQASPTVNGRIGLQTQVTPVFKFWPLFPMAKISVSANPKKWADHCVPCLASEFSEESDFQSCTLTMKFKQGKHCDTDNCKPFSIFAAFPLGVPEKPSPTQHHPLGLREACHAAS